MARSVMASSLTPQQPVRSRLSMLTHWMARTVNPSTLTQWQSFKQTVLTFWQLTPSTWRVLLVTEEQLEMSSRWSLGLCFRMGLSMASVSQSLEFRNTRSCRLVLFLVMMDIAPVVILLAIRQVFTVLLMLKYKVTISRHCLETLLSWNFVWRGRHGMMYRKITSSQGMSRSVSSSSISLREKKYESKLVEQFLQPYLI